MYQKNESDSESEYILFSLGFFLSYTEIMSAYIQLLLAEFLRDIESFANIRPTHTNT
jgi:hypothetical protein